VCHLPADLMGQADYLSRLPGPLGLEQPHSREGLCSRTSIDAGPSTAAGAVREYPRGTRESAGRVTSDAEGVFCCQETNDGTYTEKDGETSETRSREEGTEETRTEEITPDARTTTRERERDQRAPPTPTEVKSGDRRAAGRVPGGAWPPQ
ncbi:hypothetical protein NDU88_000674, partial [Pleurodeles waltl]